MKMSDLEKLFVNSPRHSKQVSHHAENLLKRIEVADGQSYLDVGCGNGAAPTYIAKKYHLNVTGIDIDPDQIRAAKQQSTEIKNTRFLTIDGTALPFDDGTFDIVFTNKVMHHIPNWEDALSQMIRVLKPGGYLLYADLVFPGWPAAIVRRMLKNVFGFPTVASLNAIFTRHQLVTVYLFEGWLHYEAILQKRQSTS